MNDYPELVDAGSLALGDALTIRDKAIADQAKRDADAEAWRKKLVDGLVTEALNAREAALKELSQYSDEAFEQLERYLAHFGDWS